MTYIRPIGDEFTHPDQVKAGAVLTTRHLEDMAAYQEYINGDLTRLFTRMAGNKDAQKLTGARYYERSGIDGYLSINIFLSLVRTMVGDVFAEAPVPQGADDDVLELWNQYSREFERAGRRALTWKIADGRGVMQLTDQAARQGDNEPVGTRQHLKAVNSQYFTPIVDAMDREVEIGSIINRLWYQGDRIAGMSIPNRLTSEVYVSDGGAALSSQLVPATSRRIEFNWGGNEVEGTIGSEIKRIDPYRTNLGIWSWGDDDSLFKTMERTVYEIILGFSNARTAMTQAIRAPFLRPEITSATLPKDPDTGAVILDLYDPEIPIPLMPGITGLDGFGYLTPPGATQAEGFISVVQLLIEYLAFSTGAPPHVFGLGYIANEAADTASKLLQMYKTMVVDAQDNIGRIMSEAFQIISGSSEIVGWEHEPFLQTMENIRRTTELHSGYLITDANAQTAVGQPVEEITPENNTRLKIEMGGKQDAIDDRPSTGPGGDIV